MLTSDYDFWLHVDDVEAFNHAVASFGLHPTYPPAEARSRGRCVLENDERVDLAATKRFAARPKDAEDLRLIEALRRRKEGA